MFSHLRAGPNEYVLHFKSGKVTRRGAGVSYWFRPLVGSVSMVPVEDLQTTFILTERTGDLQQVAVQCTLTYRVSDTDSAAKRFNFAIALSSGAWLEKPLERIESAWSLRARDAARMYLSGVPVTDAVSKGPTLVRERLVAALRADAEIASMGLTLVDIVVDSVLPTPEMQKALETPTREAVQQQADRAVFERRAAAVEKERTIKENELATQVELARRQEDLIRRQGANKLLDVQQAAEAQRAATVAEQERHQMEAEGASRQATARAEGEAKAKLILADAEAKGEELRLNVYRNLPEHVLQAVTLKELAGNLPEIKTLNVTPDLIGEGLTRFLRRQAEK